MIHCGPTTLGIVQCIPNIKPPKAAVEQIANWTKNKVFNVRTKMTFASIDQRNCLCKVKRNSF